MSKLTRTHLRKLICEEIETILDAESPSDVEAIEDAWAGGENIEYQVDHAKEAGSDPVTDHQEVMVIVQSETHLREILANIIAETRR
tara:strand:- start:530 stop:790 length:261 start_codon:yes stop_codon:yes gene_type:complete